MSNLSILQSLRDHLSKEAGLYQDMIVMSKSNIDYHYYFADKRFPEGRRQFKLLNVQKDELRKEKKKLNMINEQIKLIKSLMERELLIQKLYRIYNEI